MSHNPLQSYFRQPKIFIKLPSLGKFINHSIITGDVEKLPIYGMTGMDQILIRTPDALLNGESTVQVIQSCCPSILNAWELSNIDIDSILIAIRVATYGSKMDVESTCIHCSEQSSHELDIGSFIQNYYNKTFETSVVVDDLVVKLKPLSYKQATSFGLENFTLQKKLAQVYDMTDSKEKQSMLSEIYKEFGVLKSKVVLSSIEYIEIPGGVVSEYGYIKEWLDNCDQHVISKIKEVMEFNSDTWKIPSVDIKCSSCGKSSPFEIDLDSASFFENA